MDSEQVGLSHSYGSCPLCSSPLRLRRSKDGHSMGKRFLGCVRYPLCMGTRELDGRSIDLEVERIWRSPAPIRSYRALRDEFGAARVCNRFVRYLEGIERLDIDTLPRLTRIAQSSERELAAALLDAVSAHAHVDEEVLEFVTRDAIEGCLSTLVLFARDVLDPNGARRACPSRLLRILHVKRDTSDVLELTRKRTLAMWSLVAEHLLQGSVGKVLLSPSDIKQSADVTGFVGALACCACASAPPRAVLHRIAGLVRADDLLHSTTLDFQTWRGYRLGRDSRVDECSVGESGTAYGTLRDQWLRRGPLADERLTIAELSLELRLHRSA